MTTTRRHQALLLLATLGVFGLHLAVGAAVPTEWDVGNYLLALERFDLAQHRPHPPGYPLYVLLGRAAAWLCGDGHRGLVALASLGAALALPATFGFARYWLAPTLALWTAIAASLSPLAWYFGATGLPGVLELPAAPCVLWLLQRARDGDRCGWLLAALALGLAGGLRPNLVPFLLPAWLLVAWAMPWRDRALGALLLGGTLAAWFVPMVVVSGGYANYRAAATYLDATAQQESFLLGGAPSAVVGHALRAGSAISLAIGPAGVLGLLPLPRLLRARTLRRAGLLWAAVLPALAFFLLVLFHKKAYAFVVAPPLLVLAHAGLATFGGRRAVGLVAASTVLGTAAWFVLPSDRVLLQRPDGRVQAHEQLPAGPRFLRHWLSTSHAALRERDQRVLATDAVIAALLGEHPHLQLVVRGDQPYDARTLMQRWPGLAVWLLPAAGDGAPTLARHGEMQARDAAALAQALATAPSLWLCERDDGAATPAGRTITAPFVHAVLVRPR